LRVVMLYNVATRLCSLCDERGGHER